MHVVNLVYLYNSLWSGCCFGSEKTTWKSTRDGLLVFIRFRLSLSLFQLLDFLTDHRVEGMLHISVSAYASGTPHVLVTCCCCAISKGHVS